VQYEIAESIRLDYTAADNRAADFLRAALDPWQSPVDEGPAAVTIGELTERPGRAELQNPAGDGLSTAFDGATTFVRAGGKWCAVPSPTVDGPLEFAAEPGFALPSVFGRFVRPALQIAALRYGAVAVHGSSVVLDGRGVIVAGWSEAGKTETALALLEEGASFLSDKWTLVFHDGALACFPISIGVRRWILAYTPTLRRALPPQARAQFAAAAVGSSLIRLAAPMRRRGGVLAAAHASFEEMASLADRAALSPSRLSEAYGQPPPTQRAPIGGLVLLTTTPDGRPQARVRDAAWAARRLVRSATYERRGYLGLAERLRFLEPGPGMPQVSSAIEEQEERLLSSVLDSVTVIEVETPFPFDPQRIVEAFRPLL
jgi:hypothetical protein